MLNTKKLRFYFILIVIFADIFKTMRPESGVKLKFEAELLLTQDDMNPILPIQIFLATVLETI